MMIVPSLVVWLVTARCNLSCAHCYVRRMRGLGELSTEEAIRFIDEAAELGVKALSITGGEPFMREDLPKLIEEASDQGLELSLVTNATLLTPERARLLYKHEVFVFVSLDGADPRTHERLRGPGTWRRLLKGIELLRKAGVEFSTVTALCKVNAEEADRIVPLAEQLGAEYASFIPVMPSGEARRNRWLLLSPRELVDTIQRIDEALDETGFEASLWCMPFAALYVRRARVHFCRTFNLLDIDPAGNLLLCDILDFRFGNVRQGFEEALADYVRNETVRKVVFPKLPEPCRRCPLAERCKGGCFARAYLEKGSLEAPDPLCPRAER